MQRILRIVVIGGLMVFAIAAVASAQAAKQQPAPGPEVQRLAYFAGTWKFEGDNKASDLGPAGKFTGTETCEWFAGGFQMVCRSAEEGPTGKASGMTVMAYDPEEKGYTFYNVGSRGESLYAKGQFTGNTISMTWSGKAGGKPMQVRGTLVQVSPTSYTFKAEASVGGAPWTVIAEGKETKVK